MLTTSRMKTPTKEYEEYVEDLKRRDEKEACKHIYAFDELDGQ